MYLVGPKSVVLNLRVLLTVISGRELEAGMVAVRATVQRCSRSGRK